MLIVVATIGTALAPTPVRAQPISTWQNCVDQGADIDTVATPVSTVVRRCSIYVTAPTVFVLIASGTVGMSGSTIADEFEVELALGTREFPDLPGTQRVVDTQLSSGYHKNFGIAYVGTGTRGFFTFELRARRTAGQGTVNIQGHNLTVIAAPIAAIQTSICGDGQNGTLDITTPDLQGVIVAECTLNLPQAGTAIAIGTASVAMTANSAAAEYEGRLHLTLGGFITNNDTAWVNAYVDASGGTKENGMALRTMPLPAGEHTFGLMGVNAAGTGHMRLQAPQLAVLVIPDGATPMCAVANGFPISSGNNVSVGASCGLSVAQPSAALVLAACSALPEDAGPAGVVGVQFGLVPEAGPLLDYTRRLVRLTGDDDDGSDRSVLISAAVPVTAAFDFSFVGQRVSSIFNWDCQGGSLVAIALPPSVDPTFANGFE